MTDTRLELIRARLESSLSPQALVITDESDKHIGHAGAQDGRGHFHVKIESEDFTGVAPLQRHRLIYDALGSLMETDIHALSIEASAPAKP